ncbi:hypothetical protein [Streptomyces sp. NPDC059916]
MPAISELTAQADAHDAQEDAASQPLPPAALDAIARLERALAA